MTILDYNAGNLTSVHNALSHLGIQSEITRSPEKVENASKIIFPGVGAAAAAMENLEKSGLGRALEKAFRKGTPILGICIGCQIILESSEEDGGVKCLGFLKGRAARFRNEENLKIPHIGWNQVHFTKEHPIFAGIPDNSNFYFVHSYAPAECLPSAVYGETTYGTQTFSCVVGNGSNLIATQFHLEKSGDVGLEVLRNFSRL